MQKATHLKMGGAELSNPTEEAQPHLTKYFLILMNRRRVVIASILVVIVPVFISFMTAPVVYQATAKLLIQEKPPYLMPFESAKYERFVFRSLETQFEIVKSRPVVEKVVEILKLSPKDLGEISNRGLVRSIQNSISLEPIEDTDMALLKVLSKDPKRAKDITNTVAQVYIQEYELSRTNIRKGTLVALDEQIENLKVRLRESENALQEFKEKEGIISMVGLKGMEERKINEMQSAYMDVKTRKLKLEVELKYLEVVLKRGGELYLASSISEDPTVSELKLKLENLEKKLSQLREEYKEQYPEITQTKFQIEQVDKKLKEEAQKARLRLITEYNNLKTKEETLLESVEELKGSIREFNKKELEYFVLEREVETNRNILGELIRKVREATITSEIEGGIVRIIEPAELPTQPLSTGKGRKLLLGLVLGMILGGGAALFFEYLDTTVKTPPDVGRYLGLTVLGIIPKMKPELLTRGGRGKRKELKLATSKFLIWLNRYLGRKTILKLIDIKSRLSQLSKIIKKEKKGLR